MTTSQSETSTETTGTETGTETASTETATETTGAEATTTKGETAEAKAERLEAEVTKLRRENASERVTAKEQAAEEARKAVLSDISKALGGEAGAKAPTVEELTKQLTEQTSKTEQAAAAYRDTTAELVVWRNATDLAVDAAALTDSRAFAAAIKDLDPSSDSFEADVKKAAQAAADNNPKLKAVQATTKSGAELNGGSGEGAVSQEQFNSMSGAERNKLAQTNPTLYAQLSGRA